MLLRRDVSSVWPERGGEKGVGTERSSLRRPQFWRMES